MVLVNSRKKMLASNKAYYGTSTLLGIGDNDPNICHRTSKNGKSSAVALNDQNKIAYFPQPSIYRTLLNKLPVGIVIIDAKSGKIIECNAEFERQSGRQIIELREMKIWDLTSPQYTNSFMKQFRSQEFKHGYDSIEQELLRPDGKVIIARFDSCTITIGGLQFIQTAVHDITERKKMEDALKESEEFNSSLLDSSPYPIVVNDFDSSIIYVNRAFEECTGFCAHEVLGLQAPHPWWADFTKCKSKSDLLKIIHSTTTGLGEVFQKKNGQKIIVAINTKPVKINGKFRASLTSWIDITEQRQYENALRESEQYNASILNNSPNPILVINPDSSIRYVNPACEAFTGFSSDELIGQKKPYPWSLEERVKKVSARPSKAHCRKKRKIEQKIKKKNGEIRWIQITSTTVREGRKTKYYLSNWVDITDRKKSEKNLLTLNKELRSLSAHLESIRENERAHIAREIHDELGQSLAVLKMDVCWLSNKLSQDQESLRELTDSMAKSIDIIVQRIKRICIELRPKLLDDIGIGGTIEWLANEFEKTTRIKCKVVCDDLNEKVLDNEKATVLFRIFQEALTNVYRHSKANQLSVTLTREDSQVILKVNDNGIGIKPDQISSPKSFGLIGMRERVRHFGGQLEIEGIPNVGTQLTVRIPLLKESR